MSWESEPSPRGPIRYATIACSEGRGVDVELEDANLRYRSGLSDHAGAAFGPGALFTLRFKTYRPGSAG